MNADKNPISSFILALLYSSAALVFFLAGTARAAEDSSALINKELDRQTPRMDFHGTLPEAIAQIGKDTGVSIETDPLAYACLPWGEQTTIKARFENQTLRGILDAVCRSVGLQYAVGSQTVELTPQPAMMRLGRRVTVQELHALNVLSSTQLDLKTTTPTESQLLDAIDARLAAVRLDAAVENHAFTSQTGQTTINVPRNATLLSALEQIPSQTDYTWYPWGKSIVVLPKHDQIRLQLSRRINTRFDGINVEQALLDLAVRSGVEFSFEPGAIAHLPPALRQIRLILDNASVQQALDSISGFTGLSYTINDHGVYISDPTAPASQPAP